MASFGKKKVNAAGIKLVTMAKESPIIVSGIPDLDGGGENDVPLEILIKLGDRIVKAAQGTTFMILVAEKTQCSALVRISPDLTITGSEWLKACSLTEQKSDQLGEKYSFGSFESSTTLKTKDELNSRAFAFLRAKKLYQDDSDDDELPEFDW